MKKDDLFDAVTEIDDRHITHAEQHRFRQPLAWKRIGTLAACGVLAIGLMQFIPAGGGSDAAASEPAASAPSSGASVGDTEGGFDVYQPPVLPLFVSGENTEELERERTLTFDYSTTDSYSGTYAAAAQVTDSYVLLNNTNGEILAVVSYPYGGALTDTLPGLTVDGQNTRAEFAFSEALNGFRIEDDGSRWNLLPPQTVEPYAAALDHPEMASPAVLDEPVTVYTFTDASDSDINAATLQYQYRCDPDETTVLSYGFNGFSGNEIGIQAHDFFVNEQTAPDTRLLIVLGEDIADGTLQGYRNGACKDGEELDGLTARITRTETTLGEALRTAAQVNAAKLDLYGQTLPIGFEDYHTAVTSWYALYGPTGSDPVERYEEGRLDDLLDEVLHLERILWQTVEITIPAGESCTIEARYTGRGSFNYPGGSNASDPYGYSLMTIAPPDPAWQTTLRITGADNCTGVSCMLTATDGFTDVLNLEEENAFPLSPATGYHSFILRDK